KVRFVHIADSNVDVEAFAEQIDAAIEKLEPDLQRRIFAVQHRKDARDVIPAEPQAGADPQRAGWGCRFRAVDLLVERRHRVDDPGCARIRDLALVAHHHASRRAMEKGYAEAALDLGDALAHIRGRDAELARGAGEARATSDGADHLHVQQVDIVNHW